MKKVIIFLILSVIIISVKSQEILTPELLWKLGRVSDAQLSPDGKQILFGITYYDLKENKGNRDLYTISINGGNPFKVTDFKGSEFNGIWRPDGKKIGFLSAEGGSVQIWEMNPDGSNKNKITNIEEGINGFSYSPDMKNILFIKDVKLDKTVNDVYPDLPLANARIVDDLMYRHWDSWSDFSYSHIFYAPYQENSIGEPIDIMKNERFDSPLTPDGGLEQINWSPNGFMIAFTCKKLIGKEDAISTNSDIYIYHLDTKQTENISSSMLGYDMDPVFSTDSKKIVWSSMKTPAFESDKKRIMLYDLTTKQSTDLSANFDQSSSNFRWSNSNINLLYFISGINATYQVYSIDITTKKIEQLTNGWHDYTDIATNGNNIIGTKMTMSLPTEIFKIENTKTGLKETQITFTNKTILDKLALAKVESRWVTTTDNKKMLVWVILPPNFDKTKKYPALLYCQGGPQSAVSQFFSYRWNFQIMAANGYVIVAPNRRGLPTFGQEWNDEISQDYGGQNMNDYLTAIDTVSIEPFIDKNRMGAIGASYGGFSVYWLAGHHNKRFKAFIAHCGMFNFESWYGSTEEMWFANHDLGGAYWKKPTPKSYDFSPHKFVGNWDTPIMVIEGGNDFRIPYTEGMQAFNAAQLQGIPSRFLYFPEESHFVLKPQNSVLWQRVFFEWLDKYLK
ncbi:MAG: peptidase S9 [Bacteroidetes bacterium CG2_30_32_10]|nr:MAG: peptidase S9 [Bacteroidetes bacterium CG2_30_32_10]